MERIGLKNLHRAADRLLTHPYILMALVCLFTALTVDQTKNNPVATLMLVGLELLGGTVVVLSVTKQLTYRRALILLVAAGVLLRIGYVLYTPYTVRQHDVGTFGGADGHAAYITYIAQHLALPDTNTPWQFYHPPLHHILAALWLRLNLALGVAADAAYENVQLLTCFYSCAALLVCRGILKELQLSERATLLAMAVLCFHPTFLILAGSINNDMLMILLLLAAVLFALRWYSRPTMKTMLLTGLCLGLAMMTKFSAVMLAPVLAFLFIVRLLRQRKRAKVLIAQGLAFCGVSIPIGMWYPIRNLLLFSQSILYIPHITVTEQYVGNYSIAQRLWNIPWSQLGSPYQDWTYGYSIPLSLIKTATFGEGNFGDSPLTAVLFYFSILLAVLSAAAIILILLAKLRERHAYGEGHAVQYGALGLLWAVLLISYVKFCFQYPSICTQDFRYIVPTLLVGGAFIGALTDRLQNLKWGRVCSAIMEYTTVVFCLCSAAVYISLGKA